MTNRRPKAINDALVSEVDDEVLVFDVANDRAVNLNATAAAVWALCDGETDLDGLTTKLGQQFHQPASRDLIELAIAELDESGLLADTPTRGAPRDAMSRRTLIRRAALSTAIAVPMIVAISTPAAAQTSSCRETGSAGGFFDCIGTSTNCRNLGGVTVCDNAECCSGSCGQNTTGGAFGNCVA